MSKIYVTKPFLPPFDEYSGYLERIWESGILTNQGNLHREFESALRDFLGSPNIVLTVNGHMALDIAVKALDLKGEVITTPFTFASTTHALVLNNLTPVFCDIKENNFTINEDLIESLITENTSAIMPVHVYGIPCNVDKIDNIANKYGLKVLYDAAHAFGVRVNGKPIASFGDISMFSFHATKRFHSIEGGALAFGNQELKEKLDLLKNFGIKDAETVVIPGQNGKMNEFQAAMGLCNLNHLDELTARCREESDLYKSELSGVRGLSFIEIDRNTDSNYVYVPIVINAAEFGCTRDQLIEFLESNDIIARKYFYPLTSQYDCYSNLFSNSSCPVAETAAESVLTLPLYYELKDEDIKLICSLIRDASKSST